MLIRLSKLSLCLLPWIARRMSATMTICPWLKPPVSSAFLGARLFGGYAVVDYMATKTPIVAITMFVETRLRRRSNGYKR
jgi:hypothetical protein